ncbi:diguanylate cyclase [Glaciecola sp. SC05]|uniref:diguanylate cyclase n=1 Tax=Glaciecola sp. SC05 TaxID=1987355 RepID=UPI003529BAD2
MKLNLKKRFAFLTWISSIALLLFVATSHSYNQAVDDAEATSELDRAYTIRSSNPSQSIEILSNISREQLSEANQDRYDLINAYLLFMTGKVLESIDAFKALSENAHTADEKFNAYASLTALYAGTQNWSEAFKALDYLIGNIEAINSLDSEEQAHLAAINLYSMINEDDVLINYATPLLNSEYSQRFNCIATMHIFTSKVENDIDSLSEDDFETGLQTCENAGEPVVKLGIYNKYAAYLFKLGQTDQALGMLLEQLDVITRANYAPLFDDYYVLLSEAYLEKQEYEKAHQYALLVVGDAKPDMLVSRSDVAAYKVLYEVAEANQDYRLALELYKAYAGAKSLNITNDNAKMLSIQKARQDSAEKSNQIALLDTENSLLRARAQLDKETANNRKLLITFMIIALLITCIWVYKKRSNYIKFREISRKDGLTGIANRHFFTTTAKQMTENSAKDNSPISLILFDLDDFKSINDNFGHQTGDHALQTAVDAARDACRDNDLIGRLGGEEFGIILRGCEINTAMSIAEDCRIAIESTNRTASQEYSLTASFGVASSETCGYSFDSLFEASDKALYNSKGAGKNRVSH